MAKGLRVTQLYQTEGTEARPTNVPTPCVLAQKGAAKGYYPEDTLSFTDPKFQESDLEPDLECVFCEFYACVCQFAVVYMNSGEVGCS